MGSMRLLGLLAIVPTAVLLTISFFVLVVNRKQEVEGLKVFGYVVATLLWIGASVVFSAGLYTLATGSPPVGCMMQQMMKGHMRGSLMKGEMPEPMMKGQMPGQMMGR